MEVLEEWKRVGVWIHCCKYTSRKVAYFLKHRPIRLDIPGSEQGSRVEVLRRGAGLADDADLPEAAYDLMKLCEMR